GHFRKRRRSYRARGYHADATSGMTVNVGDRIVTGGNGRIAITLTDSSKLELDASSTLVIDDQVFTANSRRTKLSLVQGMVHSFVSYASAPTPNFEVHTPNAVASARDPIRHRNGRQSTSRIQGLPPLH